MSSQLVLQKYASAGAQQTALSGSAARRRSSRVAAGAVLSMWPRAERHEAWYHFRHSGFGQKRISWLRATPADLRAVKAVHM